MYNRVSLAFWANAGKGQSTEVGKFPIVANHQGHLKCVTADAVNRHLFAHAAPRL